jgi:hypothetical protein
MDIDDLPLGTDFRAHVRQKISKCDFILVILGPDWCARAKDGRARIAEDSDPVRMEVEAALSNGRRIIPILIGNTCMPRPTELPAALERFCYLNAATVSSELDFHVHMDRLIKRLNNLQRAERPSILQTLSNRIRAKKVARWAAAAFLLSCITAGAGYANWKRIFPSPPKSSAVVMTPPMQRVSDDISLKEHVFRSTWSHFYSGLAAQKKFDIRPVEAEMLDTASDFRKGLSGAHLAGRFVLAENLAKYGERIGRRIEFVARSNVYLQDDNVRLTLDLATLDPDTRQLKEIDEARVDIDGRRASVDMLAVVASYQLVAKFLKIIEAPSSIIDGVVADFMGALRADGIRPHVPLRALLESCRDFDCMIRATARIAEAGQIPEGARAARSNFNAALEVGRLARGTLEE